jgi:hypothetical protein
MVRDAPHVAKFTQARPARATLLTMRGIDDPHPEEVAIAGAACVHSTVSKDEAGKSGFVRRSSR